MASLLLARALVSIKISIRLKISVKNEQEKVSVEERGMYKMQSYSNLIEINTFEIKWIETLRSGINRHSTPTEKLVFIFKNKLEKRTRNVKIRKV